MPAYHVESSILINASQQNVHESLDDFEIWPVWSPWLYTEPDATLSFRGVAGEPGHGYSWEGELTGAGSMELTDNQLDAMSMDLTFLKPFKSTAKVRFDITDTGDKNTTKVTWHLDSKLPFFMFFMTETFKGMIRSDYARGLRMLKERVETGSISSRTDVEGIVEVEPQHCIGIRSNSHMDALGESMGKTLPALHQHIQSTNLELNGRSLAIYNQINIKTSDCNYTAALPVASVSDDSHETEEDMVIEAVSIKPCKAFKVVHTGSYYHLGNAWSTAIAHQRARKLKPSREQAPFELYTSDPDTTQPGQAVTELYLPIR